MEPLPQFPSIETPGVEINVSSPFDALLQYPPVKALTPIPIILLIAPLVWLMFRKTWQELDAERREFSRTSDTIDYRPMVCLLLLSVTLTIQDYYGGRTFFENTVEPFLQTMEAGGQTWIDLTKYRDLWSQLWWAFSRAFGYSVVPIVVWKLTFKEDSILDMGLRLKGFFSHLWIYGLCLVIVVGAMILLSNQKDFLEYYPFYKKAHRSWFDLLAWESAYMLQFLALEFYFRGFVLAALRRTMGAAAIFVMAVPYCMIHFGKPYLEAHGAIVAAVVLGSLAMQTRSIYAGFFVHVTVAGLMDYFALASRNGIPTRMWPE